jgi:hypothetical protein
MLSQKLIRSRAALMEVESKQKSSIKKSIKNKKNPLKNK